MLHPHRIALVCARAGHVVFSPQTSSEASVARAVHFVAVILLELADGRHGVVARERVASQQQVTDKPVKEIQRVSQRAERFAPLSKQVLWLRVNMAQSPALTERAVLESELRHTFCLLFLEKASVRWWALGPSGVLPRIDQRAR